VQPSLQKSQSFNSKGTNGLISKSKGRVHKDVSSNLDFPGPASYTNTIGSMNNNNTINKSKSSVDFVTGRERQILARQFFRNQEEMQHPRPTEYNAGDIKDFY